MNTFLRVVGEGAAHYAQLVNAGLSGAVRGTVKLLFTMMLGATLIFGVLALILALVTGAGAAWHTAGVLLFWNFLLFVVRYVVGQAVAGRFTRPQAVRRPDYKALPRR